MSDPPAFTAVSPSARQLLHLLRTIAFAPTAVLHLTPAGLRITTSSTSIAEAFIFLPPALFTTYTYNPLPPRSSQDDPPEPPTFQISLTSLLETLAIFTLTDPTLAKRPDASESFRLARHSGLNAFTSHTSGICTLSYPRENSPLSIHMSESNVSTTCDLTTYEPLDSEEIPFARDDVVLKTILRSHALLDAVVELSNLNPDILTLSASDHPKSTLALSATGSLGSATVSFAPSLSSSAASTSAEEMPVLETFALTQEKVSTSYKFSCIKDAQRAMAAAAKVSLRVDGEGVLNLQFLVEVEGAAGFGGGGGGSADGGGAGGGGGVGHTFVEFRVVPLVEREGEDGEVGSGSSGED